MLSPSFSNRGGALVLVVCLFLCAGCASLEKQPVAGTRVGTKGRIAVLPLYNVTGKPAPVREIRQELIAQVVKAGGAVIEDEGLEQFMARHRVRYVGGLDTYTANKFREEGGIEAVLVTTLVRYFNEGTPAIGITARLVSTETASPAIIWMEDISIAGDDAPGLLGLGLISDMPRLQQQAIDRIGASLASFFSGTAVRQQRIASKFHPTLAYYSPFLMPGKKYRVAVAPFLNRTTRRADEIVALHVIAQLVRAGFEVVDLGVVRERLLKARLILRDGISSYDEDVLFNSATDLIVTGKVMSYDDPGSSTGPAVEFSLTVFERKSKKMVWVSWSRNSGADRVYFFDWGWVNTAGALASNMAESAVTEMVALSTAKDAAQLKEGSGTNMKWAFMMKGNSLKGLYPPDERPGAF